MIREDLPRCSRGEIWLLDWNPRRGSEQGGFRPGLIVQSDLGNHAPGARTTIVVPLTTQARPYVFYVPLPKGKDTGLPADSWANATQLFTVDKSRLAKRLGRASAEQLESLAQALAGVLEI
ncbi:type II toxin-antitoxin system PemK/MazF family toxin [Geothrix sp. 21YS21S-4]|uniref:type II toxin-antitoxin system PemK/MazF family toxin n=1 Tax=Geothrix sp. 21YS21S-4 TaxID=3068889 RepID=UPI0027BA9F8A|nr:type II toxin-antitoxin system PemK/MazF family toxin [Geothrix sp. 21YS21S-4]